MVLEHLQLSNFRNYESVALDPCPGLNIVFGPNGAGKTNLLDAIHFLSMAKSAFGIQDNFCVREGEQFFRIDGNYTSKPTTKVVLKYKLGTRKILEKNGQPIKRIADHVGNIPVVISGPIDMELVSGSPELRRNFIDQTISQFDADYLKTLIDYHKLLKQKGAELKKQKENSNPNLEMVETYHHQMIPLNKEIFEARESFIKESSKPISNYYGMVSGDREKIEVSYTSQMRTQDPHVYSVNEFKREIAAQRNLFGIHRDDLELMVNGKTAKKYASQGQQKTVLSALKLMQVDMIRKKGGDNPIILLDDVFDRLDRTRAKNLLRIILEQNLGQTFISDTQSERIREAIPSDQKDVAFFEIKDGEAKEK